MTPRPNFPLRRTMPAAWAHVGAMQADLGRQDVRRVAEFAGLIDTMPGHGRPVALVVNGEYIPRCDWWQPVQKGDVLLWVEVPQGGDSNPLRVILSIVLVIVAPQFGPALGIAKAGSFANALVTAAAIAVGNLALNALLPLPGAPGGFGGGEQSPTYSVGLQGNQARLGQPIPVQYGQELCSPDFGSQPYAEYDANDDQYYCANLIVGCGTHHILAITIDDTDLRNFADVTCRRIGPGQDTAPGPYSGLLTFAEAASVADARMVSSLEVAGQDVISGEWTSALTLNRAGTRVTRVFVDVSCPRGLGTIEGDGSMVTYGVTWQVALRPVNDAGSATGGWAIVATENLTLATTSAVRRSFAYDVAAGRYQARLRRVTPRLDNGRTLNDFSWIGLRGLLDVVGIARSDVTGISLRVRANEQLSGLSQRRIRVLSRRLVPVYDTDTETWSAPQLTRNPAWALADIWRNASYGRGLADGRLDLESLAELADTWDARQDRFDYRFETKLTTDAAAELVARVGRAHTVLRRGSIFSVVRDELQTVPVAAFMPRNMDKDSFALAFTLPSDESTDAVELTYRDGQVWDDRIVYGQIHDGAIHAYPEGERPEGVPEPSNVEAVRFPGIVGERHALREAAQLAGDALYLRERASWSADLDATLPAYGSLVSTAHDVASWGQSGDVVNWTPGTRVLEVTEPISWPSGTAYVRLVDHQGRPDAAIVATAGASEREMVLAGDPGFTPSFDDADRERTRYLFGALADVQRYAVVRAIRPNGQDAVTIEAIAENALRHTVDNAFLPAPGEVQDPLSDGTLAGGGTDDDDEGSGGLPIVLSDFNVRRLPIPSATPQEVSFTSDGYVEPGFGYFMISGFSSEAWVPLHPIAVSLADDYEVRAELIEILFYDLDGFEEAGELTGTFDAWLSLGTTRTWSYSRGNRTSVARIRFRIRDAATLVEQATCVGELQLD